MEWREQSTVSCQDAYVEAERWIEAVTKKTFKGKDFRSALENGVLLCDLINKIKPGIIKRVNRLPTPIAGLDNINVFLKACLNIGLKEAQLFHPGDLQDLSSRVTVKDEETDRRLKNVLITLYWLGRKAQGERSYDGPYLNFKAFEGLLGTALHKALQELSGQKGNCIQDSDLGDNWYSEREERHQLRGGGWHRREDSLDSLDSLGSQTLSLSSDATLKGSSEGCCSDAEADAAFKMSNNKESLSYRRSVTLTPKVTTQFNQFLPTKDKATGYVPAPLRKKRTERNDDNRRSWANPVYMDEDDLPITRSKSTNDVNEEPVLVRRQSQYEALEKYREQVKQSDDRWQDDLSKWKNRRKSVNSDIVKKKEEREMVEQITSGGSTRRPKTYKEMQDERQNRRTSSIGSRMGSLSFDNDNDVFENPKPRPRESISRSYTVDTLYHSSGSYESARKEDKPPEVPLRSTKQGSDAIDAPGVTTTRGSFHRLKPSEATPSQRSSVFESTTKTEEISRPPKASQKVPEPKSPVKVQPPSSAAIYKPSLQSKTEANAATVSRISASLPRSYQRSDSARLSSVITPRPFGTQLSRVGSLNRTVTSDESNSRINGNAAISKNSSVPSRYHQFMTAEDEAESQSSPVQSSEDDDDTPEETMVKSVTSTSSVSSRTIEIKREVLATEPSKESTCEMRVSLNQKPNSSRDFGFDVAWDSSGAHVKAIQPGSPAEMFQLQAGDEVLTVNGQRVADMSYLDWKASMDRALQEGSLVMDIRRYGKSNWDRDPSSPLFKGHKTINLTTRDHPILVGFADAGGAMLDFTSLTDTSAKATSHSLVDVASNGIAGGYPKVSMMTQESEPISMINLKRRSEFFEKGAVDSAMPDIPVPPITASSTRWSWDPEEERRRQEKWQKEQERQLQEKYKRDQEKLQEEWTKAQQEISSSFPQSEPVGSTLAYRELQQERERLELERKRRGEEEEQERMKLEMERKLREEEFERQRQEMRRREEELEQERQEIDRKRREQEQELERQRQEMRRREEELERLKLEEERRKKEAEEERQRQAEEERRRIREKEEEEERRKREEEEERQRQAEEERRRIREKEEEEERRKREEEEERQRQAEEERRMIREKEEEEERRKREEEELLWQRRREAEKEELRRRLAATDEQQWQGRRHTFEEQRAKSLDNEERLPSSGVFVYRSSVALRLLEEQAKSTRDKMAHGQRAVSELEKQRRNLLNAKRYREPERVMGGDAVDAKFAQPPSQAELQRQQLLNDMRKKTNLLTDSSWIRQRSATTPGHEDLPSTRRGGSLDHLDKPLNSWRSSWAPRSESYIPNYSRPHSAIYGSAPVFGGGPPGAGSGASSLPPSFRGPAAGATSWSRQSASPLPSSVSPTTSSEPGPDTGGQRQRSRSVSGKKVCTLCDTALGKGAAMIIESLGLCYHLNCFKCIDCKSVLGGSEAGAEVRIRNKQLYCNTCYMRFKTGQPTPM
ncbi:LIM domain only protein 7 isoform X2 [Hippocampus zosterae]|uniref:LIM domain only protein 7 isoform X2 n=1 Tax=Hippocampus zosterae TaxID=109293 RepID=UPI00223E0A17|nr:LIM domain only protein 7 isoform X2 [Hippocampus zosterae]